MALTQSGGRVCDSWRGYCLHFWQQLYLLRADLVQGEGGGRWFVKLPLAVLRACGEGTCCDCLSRAVRVGSIPILQGQVGPPEDR